MRQLFVYVSIAAFLFASTSNIALGKEAFSEEKYQKLYLSTMVTALNAYPTYGDMIDKIQNKIDREYLRGAMGSFLKSPTRLQFIERNTVVMTIGDQKAALTVKDLKRGQFSIFKRDFTLDPHESAEAAVKKLNHYLSRRGPMTVVEPEAHALAGAAIGVGLYVLGATMVSVECGQANINSWKQCMIFGAVWPGVGFLIGVGLTYQGYLSAKSYVSNAKFDVTSVDCKKAQAKRVHAVLTTSKGAPLEIEIVYGDQSQPERVTMTSAGSSEKLNLALNSDWTVKKTDAADDPSSQYGYLALHLIEKGLKNIDWACSEGDNKVALEKFLKMNDHVQTVLPGPIKDPGAVRVNSVE